MSRPLKISSLSIAKFNFDTVPSFEDRVSAQWDHCPRQFVLFQKDECLSVVTVTRTLLKSDLVDSFLFYQKLKQGLSSAYRRAEWVRSVQTELPVDWRVPEREEILIQSFWWVMLEKVQLQWDNPKEYWKKIVELLESKKYQWGDEPQSPLSFAHVQRWYQSFFLRTFPAISALETSFSILNESQAPKVALQESKILEEYGVLNVTNQEPLAAIFDRFEIQGMTDFVQFYHHGHVQTRLSRTMSPEARYFQGRWNWHDAFLHQTFHEQFLLVILKSDMSKAQHEFFVKLYGTESEFLSHRHSLIMYRDDKSHLRVQSLLDFIQVTTILRCSLGAMKWTPLAANKLYEESSWKLSQPLFPLSLFRNCLLDPLDRSVMAVLQRKRDYKNLEKGFLTVFSSHFHALFYDEESIPLNTLQPSLFLKTFQMENHWVLHLTTLRPIESTKRGLFQDLMSRFFGRYVSQGQPQTSTNHHPFPVLKSKIDLTERYPEMFVPSCYKTKCQFPRQPKLMTEEQAQEFPETARIRYPETQIENVEPEWYVCTNQAYPYAGLQKNVSQGVTDFVPCCFGKPQKPKVALKDDVEMPSNVVHFNRGTSVVKNRGQGGALQPEIQNFLTSINPKYLYQRVGVEISPHAVLICLELYRSYSTQTPEIRSYNDLRKLILDRIEEQGIPEGWLSLDTETLLDGIRHDPEFYYDPRIFYPILEDLYGVQLAVFAPESRSGGPFVLWDPIYTRVNAPRYFATRPWVLLVEDWQKRIPRPYPHYNIIGYKVDLYAPFVKDLFFDPHFFSTTALWRRSLEIPSLVRGKKRISLVFERVLTWRNKSCIGFYHPKAVALTTVNTPFFSRWMDELPWTGDLESMINSWDTLLWIHQHFSHWKSMRKVPFLCSMGRVCVVRVGGKEWEEYPHDLEFLIRAPYDIETHWELNVGEATPPSLREFVQPSCRPTDVSDSAGLLAVLMAHQNGSATIVSPLQHVLSMMDSSRQVRHLALWEFSRFLSSVTSSYPEARWKEVTESFLRAHPEWFPEDDMLPKLSYYLQWQWIRLGEGMKHFHRDHSREMLAASMRTDMLQEDDTLPTGQIVWESRKVFESPEFWEADIFSNCVEHGFLSVSYQHPLGNPFYPYASFVLVWETDQLLGGSWSEYTKPILSTLSTPPSEQQLVVEWLGEDWKRNLAFFYAWDRSATELLTLDTEVMMAPYWIQTIQTHLDTLPFHSLEEMISVNLQLWLSSPSFRRVPTWKELLSNIQFPEKFTCPPFKTHAQRGKVWNAVFFSTRINE